MHHADFSAVRRPADTSALAGVDVRGFRHAVSNQAISHIKGRHPNVTAADLRLLPLVVSQSRPKLGSPGPNGVARLVHRATIGGVTYEHVGEVRRRQRRIDTVTFYRI